MEQYGNIQIEEIIKKKKGINKFECPKCQGFGFTTKIINMYPRGLPDSGWAEDLQPLNSDCDVCNSIGYTARQMNPKIKTEIVGYE